MDSTTELARARELASRLSDWPSLTLDEGNLQVLELLLDGSLAPVDGFMDRSAASAAHDRLRLPDGTFWPSPIVLTVPERVVGAIDSNSHVALRDGEGLPLAVLDVDSRWATEIETGEEPDGRGTTDLPGSSAAVVQLAGRVMRLRQRPHPDFAQVRRRPDETRQELKRRGWRSAVALYTVTIPERRAFDAAFAAAERLGGGLVVLAALTVPGPIDHCHYARVRAYRAALASDPDRTLLTLLPGPLPPGGARGYALAARVAHNHGCSHIVVDGDTFALLEGAGASGDELGIQPIREPACAPQLSDSQIERLLHAGGDLPAGLTFPAVEAEWRRQFPARGARGLTLFFTGLSGSGKSTIANAVRARLLERGDRRVTFLDGDLVRRHLSSELGFSREHRDLNVSRIGFVAMEITRHGGIAICAPIAPYDRTRRRVRESIEAVGDFVLVYVDTPLEECMARDPKGLYARARAGLIPAFTGVSDPYEIPTDADIVIRTADHTVEQAADVIVRRLEKEGYIREPDSR